MTFGTAVQEKLHTHSPGLEQVTATELRAGDLVLARQIVVVRSTEAEGVIRRVRKGDLVDGKIARGIAGIVETELALAAPITGQVVSTPGTEGGDYLRISPNPSDERDTERMLPTGDFITHDQKVAQGFSSGEDKVVELAGDFASYYQFYRPIEDDLEQL